MASDESEAPRLVDEFARVCESTTCGGTRDRFVGAWVTQNEQELLAALRAIEAVRAFAKDCGDNSDPSYAAGYRNGVEAVQALVEEAK